MEVRENVFRRTDSPLSDILFGGLQRLVQETAALLVEVVPTIEGQELHLGAFGEIGRLVYDQTTVTNVCFERRHQ